MSETWLVNLAGWLGALMLPPGLCPGFQPETERRFLNLPASQPGRQRLSSSERFPFWRLSIGWRKFGLGGHCPDDDNKEPVWKSEGVII